MVVAKGQSGAVVGTPRSADSSRSAELQAQLDAIRSGAIRSKQLESLRSPARPPATTAQTDGPSPKSAPLAPPDQTPPEQGERRLSRQGAGSGREVYGSGASFDPIKSWDFAGKKVKLGVKAMRGFKVRTLSYASVQSSLSTCSH